MAEKKSNFSVTCSLLSRYLKEKRGLAELGGASRPQEPNKRLFRAPPTTMSLLPEVDVSAETETETAETETETAETTKSMSLFPQQTGFGPADKKPETKEEAGKAPQLTIFYDGKVMVFDNFPADKASDLMQLAAKGSAAASAAPSPASALADRLPESCPSTSGSKPPPPVEAQAQAQAQAQANPESPMPIARRASLHRFFAKRKDRINSKAPYQVNENSSPAGSDSGKPEEARSWLGLGLDPPSK